jgi:anti-repressor protein
MNMKNETTSENQTAVVPFSFDGEPVRTVVIDDIPLFAAKDVAERLGYLSHNRAINLHCKGIPIHHILSTPGGPQNMRVLTEADVLRLIVGCKLPAAQRGNSGRDGGDDEADC